MKASLEESMADDGPTAQDRAMMEKAIHEAHQAIDASCWRAWGNSASSQEWALTQGELQWLRLKDNRKGLSLLYNSS